MIMPILKSDECSKIFNLVKNTIEEYDRSYFKARQLLRFLRKKYPNISIKPQFLGQALEWLSLQGILEKWGSSPPLTWQKIGDGNGKQ